MEETNKTLIIIPAYNEEKSIKKVLEEVRTTLPQYEIVVINDGSMDDTGKIVENMKIPLVSLSINLGYGGAVQTGLKFALEKGYDIVILFDADGQHDPRDISKLINTLTNDSVDMVIGSRFLKNNNYKIPFARKMGVLFFSFIAWLITKQRIYDITSGLQVMNRKTIRFLAKEYPMDFPDAETIILLLLSGFRLSEAQVNIRQRLNGQSMHTALKSVYYPIKMIIAIFAIILRYYSERGRINV